MTTLVLPSRLQSLISQLAQRIADSPMFAHICWLRARTFMRLEDEMTDDGYQVRAELPGIDPGSDVDVTTRDGRLTITADRSQKVDFSGRSEFGYGSFARSVPLPDGADPDSATRYLSVDYLAPSAADMPIFAILLSGHVSCVLLRQTFETRRPGRTGAPPIDGRLSQIRSFETSANYLARFRRLPPWTCALLPASGHMPMRGPQAAPRYGLSPPFGTTHRDAQRPFGLQACRHCQECAATGRWPNLPQRRHESSL